MSEAVKSECVIVSVPVAVGGTRSGLAPWHKDVRVYDPGRLSDVPTIPPWYVSQGTGAVALSLPHAAAAAMIATPHARLHRLIRRLIAPPR
jgi:hypothetical protein